MVIDAIESKLYRETPVKLRRKTEKSICKLYFSNKALELINLPSLCNSTKLFSLLKNFCFNFVAPTRVYNLQQPVSSSAFRSKVR